MRDALVQDGLPDLAERPIAQQDVLGQELSRAGSAAERELAVCQARFHEMFESSPTGIALSAPDGAITQVNPALAATLGYARGDLVGRNLEELFWATDLPMLRERYQRLRTGQDPRFRFRCRLHRKDGDHAWVSLVGSVLLDAHAQPSALATMVDDVTELHLLQGQLSHQTLHDRHTGLPNRHYLLSHLEAVLAHLPPMALVTLLHLDLDGFHAINDGLGRHVGDHVLHVVATRLRKVVADQQAMIARVGADEYAVLLPPRPSPPDLPTLTEAVTAALGQPLYLHDNTPLTLTATIGIAQRRAGRTTPAELLHAADTTLRRLRRHSTRQWALHDPHTDAAERTKHRLAATLPAALAAGQLHVRYQPVRDLQDHRLIGIEATLSWQHPQHGTLDHQDTVNLAEHTGAGHALGHWLLHTATTQAAGWQLRYGLGTPPLMLNLIPTQAADPDLIARLRTHLDGADLHPTALELRIPAGALRADDTGEPLGHTGAEAEDNLRVLADLGIRTGLHGFGAGIGSLRCLAELPVHTVQVARPVAQQVMEDPTRILSQAVHAVVHIVRDTGINVVGFPVESPEQAGCWQWVGANWGLGTLFGPPGPPEHIDRLLDAHTGI
jgi:diguanylate cyclase (GGDEF)-like protein/PAS domain S-box-containing protein